MIWAENRLHFFLIHGIITLWPLPIIAMQSLSYITHVCKMCNNCIPQTVTSVLLLHYYYVSFFASGGVSLFALILHSNDAGFDPGTTASALPIIAITLVYDFFCEALKIFTKLGGGGFA